MTRHTVAPQQSPGRPESPSELRPTGLTGTSGGLVVQLPETSSTLNNVVDGVVSPLDNATRHEQNWNGNHALVLHENVLVTAVA